MNKLTVIVLGILATASVVSAQTQASASSSVAFYAEPAVVIAFPGHFDHAVGGALAFGATINNFHSVEADVISFKTKGNGDDFKFTPVLATYKYSAALNTKTSLMVGASIGATFEKTEYYTGPFPLFGNGYYYNISETAFTSGLVGGLSYTFTNRVSLDANAHLLRLEKTNVTTAGNMVLLSVGVKVRF